MLFVYAAEPEPYRLTCTRRQPAKNNGGIGNVRIPVKLKIVSDEKTIEISLYGVVGSPLCVASDDGQKVYKRLVAALGRSLPVSLSFRNISVLTPTFLNTAVGQLYGKFDETAIRELLKVKDIKPDDAALLKRVVSNARLYFQNKEALSQGRSEISDETASSRLGFMSGQIKVPDDFDSMGASETEKMFRGEME